MSDSLITEFVLSYKIRITKGHFPLPKLGPAMSHERTTLPSKKKGTYYSSPPASCLSSTTVLVVGRRGRGEETTAAGVMAPSTPIPIIVFLLLLSAVSSSSLPPEPPEDGIQIVFVEKRIHLIGPIARVILTLEVENAATATSHASEVLLAFTAWEVKHLAIVKATRVGAKHRNKAYDEPLISVVQASHPHATKDGARLYSVVLSTHLKPGETTTLEVVYVLTDVLDPYPAKAVTPSSASQLVYYHDSAVFLSPYHVRKQVTYIKTPGNRIEYSTPVNHTSRAGAEVKYGAYYDQEPGTFLAISLQYENRPFVVFEQLERKVDISLRGHIIRVTDEYKMREERAWYKRLFSSHECPRIWSIAHTLLSSYKDRLYLNLLQGPRYGWHCMFTIAYGLPLEDSLKDSEDGRRYINLTFGLPLLDIVVNDFTTMVVLPEGSKNPQPIVPFPMEATVMKTYWQRLWALLQSHDAKARLAGRAIEKEISYSYVAARAKVVLKKKKLVAEHNVPFQVYYETNPIFTRTDPLTLFLLLIMGACLSYVCYESNPMLMLTNPLNVLSVLTILLAGSFIFTLHDLFIRKWS